MSIFGKIYFTDHSEERYITRIGVRKNMTVEESLQRDLYYKRVRKIVDTADTKHVFTLGCREFIFVKKANKLIFKTAIKHTKKSYEYKHAKLMREKNR